MNLYKVTCVYSTTSTHKCETRDVYVVADDPAEAEAGALAAMRDREYKWNDYVDHIKLMASTRYNGAERLLVMAGRATTVRENEE